MASNVYSLPDTRTVLCHPDVGTASLHRCGRDDYGTIEKRGDRMDLPAL